MPENIKEEIENKIIDSINTGAEGRLIIFKPEKSTVKADMVVERRGNYKEKPYNFKIESIVNSSKEGDFVVEFLQKDIKANKNFSLIFICFNDIKQQLNSYVWLIPSLEFCDLAEESKSKEGEKVFRFSASLDIKDKNKYTKFLVHTSELGKLILEAFENKGKFNFKASISEDTKIVNPDRLKEFITEARRNTYASNNTPLDNPRLLSSQQLEFQKGDLFYRDIYFSGNKNFIGQEIVYQNTKPIWGMSYFGSQIGKLEENFLKESLLKLADKCRFGQNCELAKRELTYQDRGKGSLEIFSGKEEVFLEGKNIYSLTYQGGLISDK